MNDRKLVRIQEKGQVTIPTAIRKKLGLKHGDLVAVMETPKGVLIMPQQVVANKALDSIGEILKEQGLSLEALIASERMGNEETLSPDAVARSKDGILKAAGSWKDIDTEGFKAYIKERRQTANRPSVKL
jgi:AbrB family looped-hinge helix DNA binding protein